MDHSNRVCSENWIGTDVQATIVKSPICKGFFALINAKSETNGLRYSNVKLDISFNDT